MQHKPTIKPPLNPPLHRRKTYHQPKPKMKLKPTHDPWHRCSNSSHVKPINYAIDIQTYHQIQTINEPTLKPITVDNLNIKPITAMQQHKPTIKPPSNPPLHRRKTYHQPEPKMKLKLTHDPWHRCSNSSHVKPITSSCGE